MSDKKREVKNCPYCAEEILVGAIKCKHCKSDLLDAPPPEPTSPLPPIGAEEEQSPEVPSGKAPGDPAPPTPVSIGQGPPEPPPVPPMPSEDGPSKSGQAASPPPPGSDRVVKGSYEYPRAGIGKRILAYIIDGLISGLPLMILIPAVVIPFLTYTQVQGQAGGPVAAGPAVGMIVFMVIAGLLGFGWSLFYYLLRDGFGRGQSWGKKICGLMVVNLDDNRPCDKGKSFVRNIVLWLLNALAGLSIVEFILILVHDKGYRLGDMLARTQVIDVELYRG